ncbi:type II toxin-antitoxin system RelE/ParE family toxin [uncultured Thiodictyon sp.]|uniref:type II toxin-antitoxin system RelE/ParE family toxin n=1 Tax=uncultured Thiodictyon sp. TaxID=1846217 RepID=UPI0025F97E9E|nr:type II toxin-antitoxin system RelE/ParE family toxin [uncultured Thiodictyon sp.]
MKVRILSAASRDLLQGHAFYERQRRGLGDYFLDSLFSDIDSLAITAGVHTISFGAYRRLLSKRFPFAVYYRVEEGDAMVYAVLDCRRRPAWIRRRLG